MIFKVRGNYDVIVIGGGHAGLEAARASARALNGRGTVALLTMDEAGIGRMSPQSRHWWFGQRSDRS